MMVFFLAASIALALTITTLEVFLVMLMLYHFNQLSLDEKIYDEKPSTWRQRLLRRYLNPTKTAVLLALTTLGFLPGSVSLVIHLISQL